MINNISGILTSRFPQKLKFFPKNASQKKIKLYLNNKLRNKSTNINNVPFNLLPNINSYNDSNKYLDENFKNSFASTFYTTKSNIQNTIYDNKNKNLIKSNNTLSHKQLLLLKSKSHSKKNFEINHNIIGIKKLNNNEKNEKNEKISTDYNDTLNSKENDYSLVIKKLDRWDQDNCFLKQYDKFSLYKKLNDYYKKKGLSQDLKNLNTMDSLLKSKSNYDRLIKNRINYKSSKIVTDVMCSPKKNNKKTSNIKINHKLKINNSTKNWKKDIDDDHKLLTEKIKYESQLHNDLIFVNNIIYNKKCLKKDVLKKFEEVYKAHIDIKQEYDKKYNNLIKDYWSTYDEYDQRYKRLEELYIQQVKLEKLEKKEEEKDNKENNDNKKENDKEDIDKNEDEIKNKEEENQEDSNTKISNSRPYSVKKGDFIKEMQFIKKTKLNSINLVLKKNLDKLKSEYKDKFKDINKIKKEFEEQLEIISKELNYYKQVNEELIREHRTYYMNLLKKGTDHRKEGLVWIVKNLLELQINLEYQHFPKFLTHEHIDYLIKLANLMLEQSELVIIIKILRKRQTTYYMDDNIQTYNMLDKFMEEHLKDKNGNKNKNNFLIGNIHQKISEHYGTRMMDIIQEIDKRFYNVYRNNKEMMKNYIEKNEEELKLRNALEHIKQGLYNSDSFDKDNQTSILDAFMCNTKNKDFFSFILKIKNRLNQLDQIIDDLKKNEKEFYIEQSKKINNSNNNNYDNTINNLYNKDIIKRSLFGDKCDF